jgi:ribonuclease VapC
MIVDSSAIIAILLDEPEKPHFVAKILGGSPTSLSAAAWVELAAVLTRRSDDRMASLYKLVDELEIAIADIDIVQARIGHDAYRHYGRGSGHPANLNFGDCFAYALSRTTGEPLLFKGDDFIHTDVSVAAA